MQASTDVAARLADLVRSESLIAQAITLACQRRRAPASDLRLGTAPE
jgi:hypothetical protein